MTSLHIATPDDLNRLLPMITAFHAEAGITCSAEDRLSALITLLEGTPLGVIYLIGPRNSPVGYIALSFTWSIALGGMDGRIDEFWVRVAVRGRGMGGDVLTGLIPALAEHGLRGLTLQIDRAHPRAQRLLQRHGFAPRDQHILLARVLT